MEQKELYLLFEFYIRLSGGSLLFSCSAISQALFNLGRLARINLFFAVCTSWHYCFELLFNGIAVIPVNMRSDHFFSWKSEAFSCRITVCGSSTLQPLSCIPLACFFLSGPYRPFVFSQNPERILDFYNSWNRSSVFAVLCVDAYQRTVTGVFEGPAFDF